MSIEAMKQALDALDNGKRVRACEGGTAYQPDLEDNAIKSLRQAIEQAEKTEMKDWEAIAADQAMTIAMLKQREWVGLTEEEWTYIWKEADTDMSMQYGREDAERMIEAKLKGKNHG